MSTIDLAKKLQEIMDPGSADDFQAMFHKFLHMEKIRWDAVRPVSNSSVVDLATIAHRVDDENDMNRLDHNGIRKLLSTLVILKLNGGLGTTMGCRGPKSAIEVKNGLTFLDIIIRQIECLNKQYDVDIPLVLMNSFNTHDETVKIISKYKGVRVTIHTFNQSRYPRIVKETYLPLPLSHDDSANKWYPPGHGDMFQSFALSGLLDKFCATGKKHLFVSNIDNLGATVDFNILNYLEHDSSVDYLMEVTDKTRSDVKGGTLIEYDGKIKLLEIAQVPAENVEEFKSIKKFKIFNTNNIWCTLGAIKQVVSDGVLQDMDIIVNNKVYDDGKHIIQLERAVGAGIEFFHAKGVRVGRDRFLPVKSTSDLFIIMSNLYTLVDYRVVVNPAREFPLVPLIKLGHEFRSVQQFLTRIPNIPDVTELDRLTVSGNVTFGNGVVLKGDVIIIAHHGTSVDIPPGAVLENKIVSGHLQILDH